MEKNLHSIKRNIAVILAVVVVFVISYFTVYEGTNVLHDCSGEKCPVCHELHLAEHIAKQVLAGTVYTVVVCMAALYLCALGQIIVSSKSERNLIIDKVRIDD